MVNEERNTKKNKIKVRWKTVCSNKNKINGNIFMAKSYSLQQVLSVANYAAKSQLWNVSIQ